MYAPSGVKTDPNFPIPDKQKAWVLGNPGELKLAEKAVPVPASAKTLLATLQKASPVNKSTNN